MAEKLQRLKRMLDLGLVTQDDYDEQRKRLSASQLSQKQREEDLVSADTDAADLERRLAESLRSLDARTTSAVSAIERVYGDLTKQEKAYVLTILGEPVGHTQFTHTLTEPYKRGKLRIDQSYTINEHLRHLGMENKIGASYGSQPSSPGTMLIAFSAVRLIGLHSSRRVPAAPSVTLNLSRPNGFRHYRQRTPEFVCHVEGKRVQFIQDFLHLFVREKPPRKQQSGILICTLRTKHSGLSAQGSRE